MRHLLFRDYLRAHPETAAEYERLKRELVHIHRSNGQQYVAGKTAFVDSVIARAEQALCRSAEPCRYSTGETRSGREPGQ